jgi:hypothetical protein
MLSHAKKAQGPLLLLAAFYSMPHSCARHVAERAPVFAKLLC